MSIGIEHSPFEPSLLLDASRPFSNHSLRYFARPTLSMVPFFVDQIFDFALASSSHLATT